MIEFKSLFQVWYNALKLDVSIKIWRPRFRCVFDLFNWDVKANCCGNEKESWCHLQVGPVLVGLEWDIDDCGPDAVA